MLGPQATPKFWTFLCQRWLGLDQSLTWSWWRALSKSPWSACEELRTTVLHYDGHAYPGQRPEAERAEMEGAVSPGQLLGGACYPTKDYGFKRWYPEQGLTTEQYEKLDEKWNKIFRELGRKS